jgi:flagellar basal body-associated protein FliL
VEVVVVVVAVVVIIVIAIIVMVAVVMGGGSNSSTSGSNSSSSSSSSSKQVKHSHYTPGRHLGDRKYSLYSFTTSALDGASGQHHAPAALYPRGKDSPVPIAQEAG